MLLQYIFCTVSVSDYCLFLRSGRCEISCEKIVVDASDSLFDFWYWHHRFRFTWHERYQTCWAFRACDVCCDIPCGDLFLHLEHCQRNQSVFRIISEKNGSVIGQNRFFIAIYEGNCMSIVVPFPKVLLMVISPPCFWIISFAMAIPRPEPACVTPVFVPL